MAITGVTVQGAAPAQGGAAPAAAPAADPAPAPAEPAAASAPATVEVDITPEELKGFTKLTTALRAEKERAKELEAKLAAAPAVPADDKVTPLVKDGKHLAAARAAGIDLDAAVAEYLAEEKADGGEAKDPRVDALLAEREAEKKAKAEEDAKKATDDEAAAKAAVEAARAGATGYVKEMLAEDKGAKWPRLAKEPDGHADVLAVAEATARKLGRPISDQEATSIFADAATSVENEYKERAARWYIPETAPAPARRGLQVREVVETPRPTPAATAPPARAAGTLDGPRSTTRTPPPDNKQMTASEAKRAMREEFQRLRAGGQ